DPANQDRVQLISLRWQIPGGFAVDWATWCAAAGHHQCLIQPLMMACRCTPGSPIHSKTAGNLPAQADQLHSV
ncbi:hypothetical protein QCD79_34060, partial [Pseudomonas quasicaspiana]|nr:hypothetical protein [Pseudomonas quasicaspiana]